MVPGASLPTARVGGAQPGEPLDSAPRARCSGAAPGTFLRLLQRRRGGSRRPLLCWVVPGRIEDYVIVPHVASLDPLVPIPAGHIRHEHLYHERAPFIPKAPGHVLEAAHLLFLGEQGEKGVENNVHEGEFFFDVQFGEVPDGHGYVLAPVLARSFSTMASEASTPRTSCPLCAKGSATRPVPMPSSNTGPDPARSDKNPTVSSVSEGTANHSSYTSAIRSPYVVGS
jgi:hypothetical protein